MPDFFPLLTLVSFKKGKRRALFAGMGERSHRKSGRGRRLSRRLLRSEAGRSVLVILMIAAIVAVGLWVINAGNFSGSDGAVRSGSARHHR